MARKSKKNSTENIDDPIFDTGFINKLLGPLKVLIKMHVKVATRELKKDISRFMGGISNLFIGLFFILTTWVLLNVSAIFFLKEVLALEKYLYSVLIVAGVNFLLGLFMFIGAIFKFKRPFLKDTADLIKESINEIKKD